MINKSRTITKNTRSFRHEVIIFWLMVGLYGEKYAKISIETDSIQMLFSLSKLYTNTTRLDISRELRYYVINDTCWKPNRPCKFVMYSSIRKLESLEQYSCTHMYLLLFLHRQALTFTPAQKSTYFYSCTDKHLLLVYSCTDKHLLLLLHRQTLTFTHAHTSTYFYVYSCTDIHLLLLLYRQALTFTFTPAQTITYFYLYYSNNWRTLYTLYTFKP